MRILPSLALSLVLASLAGCGSEGSGAPASAASGQPAAAASGKPAASGAAATLPDGVVPVAKLWDVVQADAKAVTGKKVQIEGTYWGLTKETSEGKVTYSLEIVASKSDTSKKAFCHTSTEPKDLPSADNQAHDQAIAVTAEGTLQTTGSGKPLLKDCTYKKK